MFRIQSNNVVNYDEKVMDGFYDVYGLTSNSVTQGKMPLLADLQAIRVSDNVDYEVILVNRVADKDLRYLEERVSTISLECQAAGTRELMSTLIQRIAKVVVAQMGGPVSDADEMLRRWTLRSSELRNLMNTIILPLGCLDVGLSRHRALLFKHAISLQQQLQYYKEYQGKLVKVAGGSKAASIFKDALYLISTGNTDFAQNYYVNPFINKVYTADQYGSYLVGIFQTFVKDLYGLGARRIGVTSLPPLGCLPAVKTLFGSHEKGCVSYINTDAQAFNKKVNAAATKLRKQLPGLKIVIFDIYQPLYDLVKNPSSQGFVEATRGCCGTGKVETTVLLCNPKSVGTCKNASQYVFWDSFHPSQAANQILADALLVQGIALLG